MKKTLVVALLVGLAGVAAAGVGVHRLANGRCPLSGEEIGCKRSAPAAVAMPTTSAPAANGFAYASASGNASCCPEAAAAAAAAQVEACEEKLSCEEQQERECCKQKRRCGDCEEPAVKPAVEKP